MRRWRSSTSARSAPPNKSKRHTKNDVSFAYAKIIIYDSLCKQSSLHKFHQANRPSLTLGFLGCHLSLRIVVAKAKTIEYCFRRVKPSKARRVPSFSLGNAKVIDYATMAELDEREEARHQIKTKGTHKVYLLNIDK